MPCSSSTTTAWRHWPTRPSRTGPGCGACRRADTDADVSVLDEGDGLTVRVRGAEVGHAVPGDGRPGNIAAAVAVALELGVDADDVVAAPGLRCPGPRIAWSATVGTGGVVVLDDTYNANPAGARAAAGRVGSPREPTRPGGWS